MKVQDKLQDLLSSCGKDLKLSTGYIINISKWGLKRKSFILTYCKPNDNVFKQIGTIKKDCLDDFVNLLTKGSV